MNDAVSDTTVSLLVETTTVNGNGTSVHTTNMRACGRSVANVLAEAKRQARAYKGVTRVEIVEWRTWWGQDGWEQRREVLGAWEAA